MRIALFLEHSEVTGGIEVFARRQKAQLDSAGHETAVFGTFSDFEAADSACPFDEIIVHKCTDVSVLERFPSERTVLYVHDHDPICPRSYAYTPFGRNCTRSSGLWPCLFCAPLCRGWKAALGRVFSQGRRKKAMSAFKKIVVISSFMKRRLAANGIPAGRIEVRPPEIRRQQPPAAAGAQDLDIVYVGQLIRGKGVHLLLKAMALLGPERRLDIVGAGNMEGKLKRLAESLGLSARVVFHGFSPDPSHYMARAACIAVPSFWQEPYGLVAAEASALGKPVVAFAVGGLPEACGPGATLVPPGDVRSLALALDKTGRERNAK